MYKLIKDIKRKSLSKAPKEEEDIYPKIIKDLESESIDTPYGSLTVYTNKKTDNKYVYLGDLYITLNSLSPLPYDLFFTPSIYRLLDGYTKELNTKMPISKSEPGFGLINLKNLPALKNILQRDVKRDKLLDYLSTNTKPVNKNFITAKRTYCYSNEAFNVKISLIATAPDQIFIAIPDIFNTLNVSMKKAQEIFAKHRAYFTYSEELDDPIIHIDNLVHLFEINELPVFYQVKDTIINYLDLLLDIVFKFKSIIQNTDLSAYFKKSEDLVEFGSKELGLYYDQKDHTVWISETRLLTSLKMFESKPDVIDNINKLLSLLPSDYIKHFENIGLLLKYDNNTIQAIKKVINNENLIPVLSEIEEAIKDFTTKDDSISLEDIIMEELDGITSTPVNLTIEYEYGLKVKEFDEIMYKKDIVFYT